MELQTLNLKEAQVEKIEKAKDLFRKTFWKRQFQVEATEKQKVFDGIFGVVLPVICFLFDPIVFKGGIWGFSDPFFGSYKAFAYILSFALVMALLAFLMFGEKLKWLNGLLSGLFAVGALISLAIGIVISPISILGLIVLIGVLGFTPLFTGFVLARNSARAYKSAQPILDKKLRINCFALSAIFSLVLPYLVNVKIHETLDLMLNGNVNTVYSVGKKLKYIAPLVNLNALARQYRVERSAENTDKQTAIADVYSDLSGENIEREVNILND